MILHTIRQPTAKRPRARDRATAQTLKRILSDLWGPRYFRVGPFLHARPPPACPAWGEGQKARSVGECRAVKCWHQSTRHSKRNVTPCRDHLAPSLTIACRDHTVDFLIRTLSPNRSGKIERTQVSPSAATLYSAVISLSPPGIKNSKSKSYAEICSDGFAQETRFPCTVRTHTCIVTGPK